MNELLQINTSSIEYQNAMTLHTQIITSGSVAASALVDMCQGLKKMRDSRQYIHLGYHDFDEYAVSACRMKARQAYTYISTIERLGETALQSNANLGITKLALLASVSEEQREDILVSHDVEDMSTRELQKLTEELTKAREQISLLETEKASTEKEIEEEDEALEKLLERIKELEEEKENTGTAESKPEVDFEAIEAEKKAAIEKAKREAEEAAKKAIAEAKAKALRDAETMEQKYKAKEELARKAGREQGREEGANEAKKGLEAIEREKAEALAKAQELEKKLAVSGNSETVLFSHLFAELQDVYNKLIACSARIAEKQPEAGVKYKTAIRRMVLEILPSTLPPEAN